MRRIAHEARVAELERELFQKQIDRMALVEQLKLALRQRDEARAEVERWAVVAAAHTQSELARQLSESRRRCDALEAENARLHSGAVSALKERNNALDQLAAANALLDDALEAINQDAWTVLTDAIRAHLSSQPAAPYTPERAMAEADPTLPMQPPGQTAPMLCARTEGEHGRGELCRLPRSHDGTCRFYDQPAAPDPRDAEIARLIRELSECRDNSATRLAYSEQYRAEVARLRGEEARLAQLNREACEVMRDLLARAEAAEQKLAEAVASDKETNLRSDVIEAELARPREGKG